MIKLLYELKDQRVDSPYLRGFFFFLVGVDVGLKVVVDLRDDSVVTVWSVFSVVSTDVILVVAGNVVSESDTEFAVL